MNYKALNEKNRRLIRGIVSSDTEMSWEDPRFIYEVVGEFAIIRETSYDNKLVTELAALKEHYHSYDFIKTNRESFIKKIELAELAKHILL